MPKEFATHIELQGTVLRNEVEKRLVRRIAVISSTSPAINKTKAISGHLDELGIDWNIPRSEGQINSFLPSVSKSLQLAHIATGRPPQKDSQLPTPELAWDMIQKVLQDPDMSRVFHENIWRPSSTFFPLRASAAHNILRHQFGDKSLKGIDLGAGIHYILPLINSSLIEDTEFNKKGYVSQFAQPVNLALGIGLDKQDRKENVLWTKTTGLWSDNAELDDELMEEALGADVMKFPFITADLSQPEICIAKIKEILVRDPRDKGLDFVTSMFVGYQLSDQMVLRKIAARLLKEGGIWIDIGEELVNDSDSLETFDVNVYRMEGSNLVKLGIPFTVKEDGEITTVDTDYFSSNPKQKVVYSSRINPLT
jgi:hypothetical protein